MFTLAHLSDLHLALTPKSSELASKRGLGYINWQRKRKYIHRPDVLDAITRDLKARSASHVAVTGDLVNFSLPGEYAWAKRWLETIGRPNEVTVAPGNHDVVSTVLYSVPRLLVPTFCGLLRKVDGAMSMEQYMRRLTVPWVQYVSPLGAAGRIAVDGALVDS